MNKYYRGQFAISVYDEDDDLVFTVDSIREFADMIAKPYRIAITYLQKLFNMKNARLRYRGKLCTVAFPNMLEDEEKQSEPQAQ